MFKLEGKWQLHDYHIATLYYGQLLLKRIFALIVYFYLEFVFSKMSIRFEFYIITLARSYRAPENF